MYIQHKNMNDLTETLTNGSTVPGAGMGGGSGASTSVNDLNTNGTYKSLLVVDNQPKRRVSIASDPAAENRHNAGYDNPAFEQNPRRKISQTSVHSHTDIGPARRKSILVTSIGNDNESDHGSQYSYGMQKLFETLPLFLGPYIVDIITALSSIGTRITAQRNEKDQRSVNTLQKINNIWSKIATEVPVRILVPSCAKSYKKLMVSKNYADIKVLMKLLHQSLTTANNNDLATVRNELTDLFMEALEFRVQLKNSKLDSESINLTEAAIIDALVAWVLKLSESSFRPLYHKLYNWALQESQAKENVLTYFLLTNKIAESLKSLFVLFASDFIEDAARLLNESNANKTDIAPDAEYLTIELLKAILQTMFNIFLYDSKDFVNSKRFEYLMPAIVDQLENRLVLEQDVLQKLLSDCIAQLAVDVSNDVLWKQLNYQVLLKTRTTVPEVRIFAFNSCIEIARKLGDDFTPLLPETVPFIAELFEDENPRVEKNTRKTVQELEVILGESLQKYL